MAKIMLVEDDNNLREIYEARLLAEGYEIVSAKDGEEALALAVKEKPDLIISDVMMPKISGFDMLDILRSTPETKNTKVIMMTALSQAEDKMRADKLGADRYLVKSQVTLEDVAKVAHEVLSGEEPAAPAPEAVAAAAATSAEPAATPEPVTPDPEPVTEAPAPVAPTPDPVADEPAAPVLPVPDPAVAPSVDEPVTIPAPEPPVATPTPPSDPIVAAPLPDPTAAQTMQDEENNIEDQINQFVATTTPDTPEPAVVTPEPSAAMPPVDVPNPEDMITAEPAPDASAPTIEVAAAPPETTEAAAETAAKLVETVNEVMDPAAAPAPEPTPPQTAPDNSINGKKVITPINDLNAPGPDLNKLAEAEAAKETADEPVPTPGATAVIDPAAATNEPVPTPPQPGNTVDPGSVAL